MRLFLNSPGLPRLKYTLASPLVSAILIGFLLCSAGVSAKETPSFIEHGDQGQSNEYGLELLRRSIPVHTLAGIPDHSQCALVHEAEDQCAWIRDNCEDQDSGLLSYLELYYCKLPQAKPFAMTLIVLWLVILFSTIGITASDYFCVNLSTISTLLGLSESVTGVTLLAFGNGSPDVFSTWAAMSSNSGSLAIGELIGAAGFITAVVAGSMAIVRPFKVARKSFIRDLGFFIIATAFSLAFLIDGHLQLWECILMVAYYVFYVIVVIIWHWRSKKRKAKKARDLLAREHFIGPEYTDSPADEEEEEEDGTVGAPRNIHSEDEFDILERSEAMHIDEDNEDDETRDRYMAELTTSMRISRPRGISRENSRNPIRPSLVGALEFRAVLSSLERSKSQLSIPLYLRRYSDDAVTSLEQQHRLNRANSDLDPIAVPPPEAGDTNQHLDEPLSARPRAVSTNALDVRTPTGVPGGLRMSSNRVSADQDRANLPRLLIPDENEPLTEDAIRASPTFLNPRSAERSPHYLSPVSPISTSPSAFMHESVTSIEVPDPQSPLEHSHNQGNSSIGQRARGSHFAPYHDDPNRGELGVSIMSLPGPEVPFENNHLARPARRWWPDKYIPSAEELLSTLFPTLTNWSQRSLAQKILGLITAPSVFLLNITLPVVETANDREDEKVSHQEHTTANATTSRRVSVSRSQTPIIRAMDEHGRTQSHIIPPSDSQSEPSQMKTASGWRRWLLCTQLMFAPAFVILTFWANFDDDHDIETLLLGLGVGLVLSLSGILMVLLTSDEKTAPSYRPVFCIVGFAVSVSWISTIANEVVGILKTLGIVLNISEAILGLTVFAVGSSLGDLVADITIARLGYPMMALSACFGGPMLNILLGIGLGGIYLLVQRGDKYHHKHPDRPIRYKAYHIAIDRTLVVSSVALLITLIGLAIAVPMNGWRMSRRIGWALIIVWTIATAINLGIEIKGLSKVVQLLSS